MSTPSPNESIDLTADAAEAAALRARINCLESELARANRHAGDLQASLNSRDIDLALQKKSERILQQTEERWQLVMSHLPTAVWMVDRNMRITLSQGKALDELNLRPGQLVGSKLSDYLGTDDPNFPQYGSHLRALEGESSAYKSEWAGRHYSNYISPVRDANGVIEGVIGIAIDITERTRVEESLRAERLAAGAARRNQEDLERKLLEARKLESLAVLAGGIAHDFNNLLAIILGYASILDRQIAPESPLHALLEPIVRTSERAAELCKQMLAYSGKGKVTIEAVDLNRVVEEMSGILALAVPKMVTLRTRLAPSLPAIEADGTQIRQVVMNLVINAAEAVGDAAGTIDVATSIGPANVDGRGQVLFEVADSGCGMDDATQAKIFEPFYSTKFAGRGLGLATVQGIVRGHKGTIEVDSAIGRGTRFRVLLPAAAVAAAAKTAPTPSAAPAGTSLHGRVLVIDDEPGIRHVLGHMLKTLGFDPIAAGDGEEGIERFREAPESFVLVFLDLTMPRLDGEETFRLLHIMRPDLPVILMSGYSEQESAAKFVGRNVAGFMTKPFALKRLEEKVRRGFEPVVNSLIRLCAGSG